MANFSAEIKEIWIDDSSVSSLNVGEHGSILLKGIDKEYIELGSVVIPQTSNYSPPKTICVRLLVLEGVFVPGTSLITHCGASYSSSRLLEIQKILNQNQKQKHIRREMNGKITLAFEGELIDGKLELDSPLVVDQFNNFPELGRIIIRRAGQTVGVGIVTKID